MFWRWYRLALSFVQWLRIQLGSSGVLSGSSIHAVVPDFRIVRLFGGPVSAPSEIKGRWMSPTMTGIKPYIAVPYSVICDEESVIVAWEGVEYVFNTSTTIANATVMHVDAILDSGATALIFPLNYHNLSKFCRYTLGNWLSENYRNLSEFWRQTAAQLFYDRFRGVFGATVIAPLWPFQRCFVS